MKPVDQNKKNGEFFTTGQVADFCGVNFRTVIRWIQKGYLEAQKLPGRGDHRIAKDQLVKFFKQNNLPIPSTFTDDIKSSEVQSAKINNQFKEKKRVLIVDDDEAVANSIQRVLRMEEYDTKIAINGFEAGRLIESFKPDVITLDLIMMGMDGIAVLESLKNDGKIPAIKVIIISGDSDSKVNDALRIGASDFIKKPFTNKELAELIKKHTISSTN